MTERGADIATDRSGGRIIIKSFVSAIEINDAYLRRARLEVGAGFGKHTSFTMDIRSDRVNQGFRDEGEFKIGDAVSMSFRIKDRDALRHFQRYFWKAVPVLSAAAVSKGR